MELYFMNTYVFVRCREILHHCVSKLNLFIRMCPS